MTVKELREQLADMPEDAVVDVDDVYENGVDCHDEDDEHFRFWKILRVQKAPDRITLICDIITDDKD